MDVINTTLVNVLNVTKKCTKHLNKSELEHDHSAHTSMNHHGQHNLHDGMIVFNLIFI